MEQRHLINGLTTSKCLLLVLMRAGATQQIIQTLGGLQWGVLCLTHKGVIELFNKMSRQPRH